MATAADGATTQVSQAGGAQDPGLSGQTQDLDAEYDDSGFRTADDVDEATCLETAEPGSPADEGTAPRGSSTQKWCISGPRKLSPELHHF